MCLDDYWGDSITKMLASEAAAGDCPFVLNVASQEYAKSVSLKALGVPVITAVFPGSLCAHSNAALRRSLC